MVWEFRTSSSEDCQIKDTKITTDDWQYFAEILIFRGNSLTSVQDNWNCYVNSHILRWTNWFDLFTFTFFFTSLHQYPTMYASQLRSNLKSDTTRSIALFSWLSSFFFIAYHLLVVHHRVMFLRAFYQHLYVACSWDDSVFLEFLFSKSIITYFLICIYLFDDCSIAVHFTSRS